MKKNILFAACIICAAILAGCALAGDSAMDTPEDEAAKVEAGEKATVVLDTAMEALATGDYTELESLLAAEDQNGELAAILESHGMLGRDGSRAPSDGYIADMPPFLSTDSPYANGDILLCRGTGSPVSILMKQILPKGYGHAGVLLKIAGMPDYEGFPCVLTADLALTKVGVCFQTFEEWKANDSVAVMRWDGEISSDAFTLAIGNFASMYVGRTLYAFLKPLSPFQPVTKDENTLWYCSKVAYRLYRDALGGRNTEAADFYGHDQSNTTERWARFTYHGDTPSLMYEVYWWYLRITRPFKSRSWVTSAADNQLIQVLDVLVTPDELRWCGNMDRVILYGSDAPESEWGM